MKKLLAVMLIFALAFSFILIDAAPGTTVYAEGEEKQDKDQNQDKNKDENKDENKEDKEENKEENKDEAKEEEKRDLSEYFCTMDEALERFGLEEAPKSAVALSWTDNSYLIDAGIEILALPDNHHIPEEILEKNKQFTDHDGNINYDMLKELKPAVFFVSEKTLEKNEELKKFLEEQKILVKEFPKAENYQDVLKLVGATAVLFGTQEKAEESINKYLDRIDDAREMLEDAKDRKVAVLMVTKEGRTILTEDNFTASLLHELDLVNVADDMDLEGEADKSGYKPAPEFKALADAGCEAIVMMVRMKGEKELKEKTIEELTTEIKDAFGEDSELVANERYGVVDHHGMIIAIPNAISGIENIADIASR